MRHPPLTARALRAPRPKLSRAQLFSPHNGAPVAVEAEQSMLVPRYPGKIDEKPVLTENVTLLSGIYLNFLQLVVESLEAEIGPLDEDGDGLVFGHPDLKTMLDDLSYAIPGVTRGRIVGLQLIRWTHATAGAIISSTTLRRTPGVTALFFGAGNIRHPGAFGGGFHAFNDVLSGAIIWRGGVEWLNPFPDGSFRVHFLPTKLVPFGGTPQAAVSGSSFVMTGVIIFLKAGQT